jgi:hypothetical protein
VGGQVLVLHEGIEDSGHHEVLKHLSATHLKAIKIGGDSR